jgi:hypothetical protein
MFLAMMVVWEVLALALEKIFLLLFVCPTTNFLFYAKLGIRIVTTGTHIQSFYHVK